MKHHLHHSGMECCIRIGNLVESSWFPLQLETKLLPPNHNRFGFGKPVDQLEGNIIQGKQVKVSRNQDFLFPDLAHTQLNA